MKFLRSSLIVGFLAALAPLAAQAQFKGYFDITKLEIADLKQPDWGRRQEDDRVRYLCVNAQRCPVPTAVEIKGVLRAEPLPEAFESGALSPERLKAAGEANAARTGSTFLGAEPVTVGAVKGVHMEASADFGGAVYFVTRWLGRGDRMLDVKVTARDLNQARELADQATRSLVPQVFGP